MPFLDRLRPLARALSHPSYRNYAIGNGVSVVGTWMQRIAAGWYAWELTESGAWIGALAFMELFPSTVFGPIGGAIVDRVDRLRMVQLTQALSMLTSGLMALAAFTGTLSIWLLAGLICAHGIIQAFAQPARLSLIAHLVPKQDLPIAVAINSITFNTARFVGPTIAGVVIVVGGASWAFLANAASYAVLLVMLGLVHPLTPTAPEPRESKSTNLLGEIMEGWRYAASHPGIGPILGLMIVSSVLTRPVVELMPGFAGEVFQAGAEGLARLVAAIGIGAIIGGLFLAQRERLGGLTRLNYWSGIAVAVLVLLFTATDDLTLGITILGISGGAMVFNGTAGQTLVQAAVAAPMRGRVLGIYGIIFRGGPALGALIMGALSELWGLRWPVAGGAILALLYYAWFWRRLPGMTRSLEGG
ncbi:MAG: MFS transporter [Alphaproteobacteria bacterium]|nr:MFS transporter [Alphaproteobacteria bacterium]